MSISGFFLWPFGGYPYREQLVGLGLYIMVYILSSLSRSKFHRIRGSEELGNQCIEGRRAYVSRLGVQGIAVQLIECLFERGLGYFEPSLPGS